MKKITWLSFLLLILRYPTLGQMGKPAIQPTTSAVIDAWIANTENHLMPLADTMPEDKYSFVPNQGEFKNVRTFGEQLKHLAANNYWATAVLLGEKPTADQLDEKGPDSVKTKAEILAYLKGSFAALHGAVATINDKNLVQPIPNTSGTWQRARLGLVVDAIAHSFDHYGQLVEYLRVYNLVPPASR